MDAGRFRLIQKTLIRRYGAEKTDKIFHSKLPVNSVILALAWEDSDFFRKWFLANPRTQRVFVAGV